MSQHDGRLYNYLDQIVKALKTHSTRPEDKKTPVDAVEKLNKKTEWSKWISPLLAPLISVCALTVSIFSYNTASTALRVSNRAYVGVGDVSIYCPPCDHPNAVGLNDKAAITINVKNFGKTPASDAVITINRHSEIGHSLPSDFDFAEDGTATPPAYISPDTTVLPVHLSVMAADIVTARNQIPVHHQGKESLAEHLYIYGHVSYTDVFKEHHTVLFCRGYTGPVGSMPEFWSRCATHEGEDDSYAPKMRKPTPGFAAPQFDVPEPPDNGPPAQAPPRK